MNSVNKIKIIETLLFFTLRVFCEFYSAVGIWALETLA